jgi:hypothetical protein
MPTTREEYVCKLGRLRLIRCAPKHPNTWMIVWRRKAPERPQTKWAGSDEPGRYWKGCDARLQRKRGVDPEDAVCRFPSCDCWHRLPEWRREEWERRCEEWKRRRAEGEAYRKAWMSREGK